MNTQGLSTDHGSRSHRLSPKTGSNPSKGHDTRLGAPVTTDAALDAEPFDIEAPKQDPSAPNGLGRDRPKFALRGELLNPLPGDVQDCSGIFGSDEIVVHVAGRLPDGRNAAHSVSQRRWPSSGSGFLLGRSIKAPGA